MQDPFRSFPWKNCFSFFLKKKFSDSFMSFPIVATNYKQPTKLYITCLPSFLSTIGIFYQSLSSSVFCHCYCFIIPVLLWMLYAVLSFSASAVQNELLNSNHTTTIFCSCRTSSSAPRCYWAASLQLLVVGNGKVACTSGECHHAIGVVIPSIYEYVRFLYSQVVFL